MTSGKPSHKRSLPFHSSHVKEHEAIALALLSLHDSQQKPTSISMTTTEVLLQYLFETRIDIEWTVNVEKTIQDITQIIASYVKPSTRSPIATSSRSSLTGFKEAMNISMTSSGPAKKRLKRRYHLENELISTKMSKSFEYLGSRRISGHCAAKN